MKYGKKYFALCLGNIRHRDSAAIARYCMNEANQNDALVYTFSMDEFADSPYDVYRLVNFNETDGIIIFTRSIKNPEAIKYLMSKAQEKGVPAVAVDGKVEGCINVDFAYGSAFEKMVKHVIHEHGCRNICMLAGIKDNSFSDERIDVYRKVLEENDIEFDSDKVFYGDFWREPTLRAMDELFGRFGEPPEAIVCVNDSTAVAVCEALDKRGYSVPDDVIVTGFDGIYEGENCIPSISTAKQDLESACVIAVDILLGKKEKEDVSISFSTEYRQSCGCMRRRTVDRNQIVTRLTTELANCYDFDEFISTLNDKVITSKNMREATEAIEEYSFERSFVCINKSFFNFSSKMSYNTDRPFDDELIVISHKDRTKFYRGETVERRKLLPEETGDRKIKEFFYVFSTVKFVDKVLGYAAIPIFIDNMYYYSFEKYLRTLAQSLTMLHSQQHMEYLFSHDPLTGLFNRRGFFRRLEELIAKNSDSDYMLNIFSFDMDNLKTINDTFGHNEGDFAIKAVAESLDIAAEGRQFAIARFGGDEFIAACIELPDGEPCEEYIVRFRDEICRINAISCKPYKVAVSSGYSSAKITANLVTEDVIRTADMMMYADKAENKRSAARENAAPQE